VIGLDTNVLLRYFLRDDPAQAARAERELARDELAGPRPGERSR
jgi:predicted nucleic-acid-binding protein